MKRKSHSIRTILFLNITAFFTLSVLITSIAVISLYVFSVGEILNDQMVESSKQVITNYETYFNNVISVSNTIQEKCSNEDINEKKVGFANYFDNIMNLRQEISCLAFYDDEGLLIVSDSVSSPIYNASNEGFFKKANEEPLINNFSKLNMNDGKYYITISKYVPFDNGTSSGVLRIDFDFSKIVESISNTNLGTSGHIVIYDKNYEIIFTSLAPNIDKDIIALKSIVLGSKVERINNVDYNIYVSTITNTTWKVGIFNNREKLTSAITTFLATFISCSVLLIFGFIILTLFISARLSNPLRKLKREMAKIENLNYDIYSYSTTSGSKEVEELDNSFKQMMLRIKLLTNKIIEEKENLRKSELNVLQNQINPHFLYNTLDSIIYMIDLGKNDVASEMITALSKFFRLSISRGKTIISFKDEFEHARNYLLIQKLRFKDKFDYSFDIDPKIYDYYTVKLILQPIIENAIAHGLKEVMGVGKIEIIGRIEEDLIHISIKDNGFGMLESKIKQIYDSFNDSSIHEGVGIKNVYERLKLYYGEKANVTIDSTLDIGTIINIFIPLEGAKHYEN